MGAVGAYPSPENIELVTIILGMVGGMRTKIYVVGSLMDTANTAILAWAKWLMMKCAFYIAPEASSDYFSGLLKLLRGEILNGPLKAVLRRGGDEISLVAVNYENLTKRLRKSNAVVVLLDDNKDVFNKVDIVHECVGKGLVRYRRVSKPVAFVVGHEAIARSIERIIQNRFVKFKFFDVLEALERLGPDDILELNNREIVAPLDWILNELGIS